MNKISYLIVAERSVQPLIDLVIESLERHGHPAVIHIVVPGPQLNEFSQTRCRDHLLVAEEDVLPAWPLARVASCLPRRPYRSGWYLQQFLKLQFGLAAGVPRYVIWDADTVMLRTVKFEEGGEVLMNAAREYHRPYFRTYERLFDQPATLPKSVIAQYMSVDVAIVSTLQHTLECRHQREWIEVVLASLPQESNSEFSEYETYANFLNSVRPGTIRLVNEPWFRHGSQVLSDPARRDLARVDRTFRRFAYVAFERHRPGFYKTMRARLLWLLGVGAGPSLPLNKAQRTRDAKPAGSSVRHAR